MAVDLLEAARGYHEAGLQVLPCRHGEKTPISAWKEYTQRPQTAEDVRNLFPAGQARNIAIIGGAISRNFVGLDFDDRKAFLRLVESSPGFARLASTTPIVKTGRGVHVYIRTPAPVESSKVADLALDVKSEGGYVVAPPSLHRSGQLYLFADGWKIIREADPASFPFPLRLVEEAAADNLAPLDHAEIYEGGGFYGLGKWARHVLDGWIPRGGAFRSGGANRLHLRP